MKEQEIRNRKSMNRYLELLEDDCRLIVRDKAHFTAVLCPACKLDEFDKQFQKNGFDYVLCRNCGTLYANPRPSPELLEKLYKDSKSSKFWVEEFFKPVAEARREKIFKPRAQFVAGTVDIKPDWMIGDVGAGFGLFLEELSKIVPSVRTVAIEPSPDMAKICKEKNIEVIESMLEEVKGYNGKFNMLTAFELFEHLFDPAVFLEKIRSLLVKGGYFLLTTLNAEGFDIEVLWEKSKGIMPPHHINFFNPDSIRALLKSSGFEVESVSTPGKLDWDIVEGMIKEDGFKGDRFWTLLSEKGNETAKKELQAWIGKYNFSSHMRVLARSVK
ncbi:MAG: class I SAM-dependent methyltransferase [Candidatus Margulisiibacteriota bacterium]